MAFQRDPLSVQYDPYASAFLDEMWGLTMTGGRIVKLAYVPSPAGDPGDGLGLTVHERAWTRAMYYQVKRRAPERSLKITWGEAIQLAEGQVHAVRVELFPKGAGQRYAGGLGQASYVQNPTLRSASEYNF